MHDVVRDLLHVGHFKEYFSSLVITNSQVLSRMTEGVYYFKMCCFFFSFQVSHPIWITFAGWEGAKWIYRRLWYQVVNNLSVQILLAEIIYPKLLDVQIIEFQCE